MEPGLSLFAFLFGVATWAPFLNNVFGHDIASNIYRVDCSRRGGAVFYKDVPCASIGHYVHLMLLQKFWGKDNTKAFYWMMCLYTSFSSFILFWILSRLFGPLAAVCGSMLFSIYIVSPRLEGNWGVFEQLIPLPLFGSILCILISSGDPSYPLLFLGGMLLGYAVLIKQVAALYLPGYFMIVAGTGHSLDQHMIFLSGIILANAIPLCYYGFKHHAFREYLVANWLALLPSAIHPGKYNKLYPKLHVRGEKDPATRKAALLNNSRSLPPMLFLSMVGLTSCIAYHSSLLYFGLSALLISSVLMIFMRGTFFAHYWLNIVPWLAIFSGLGLSVMLTSLQQPVFPAVLSLFGILTVILLFVDAFRADGKYYAFSKDPYQFLRNVWGEAVVQRYKLWHRIGEYVKKTTQTEDRILVCGWAPHVLLYSDRIHFTKEICLYTEDYLDIYNRENPSISGFLNSIFKFKNFKIAKQVHNVFHEGYPEVILFEGSKIDIEGFEELTGIKYSLDVNVEEYPLFRADPDLAELISCFEKTSFDAAENNSEAAAMQNELMKSVNAGNWDRALVLSKNLLKIDPSNTGYLLTLGDCLMNSGKYSLLFNFYKRIIEKHLVPNENKPQLMNKLGESFFSQKRYDVAMNMFKKALSLNPDNTTVLNNLGVVFYNQRRSDTAEVYFRKVLEVDPKNEDALANLATLG